MYQAIHREISRRASAKLRNPWIQTHSFFRLRKNRSIRPFCSGVYGQDEFLAQAVAPAGGPKSPTLEDEAVVAADDRSLPLGPKRPESPDAGALERHRGFLRPAPEREFQVYDLPVMAVDHGREKPPAVASAVHVGHVERPAAIALDRPAALPLDARRGVTVLCVTSQRLRTRTR